MNKKRLKYLTGVGLAIIICCYTSAQEKEKEKKTYVTQTFKDGFLINTPTTEIATGLEFRIQHRFGGIGFDSTLIGQFFGMDLPANIRFALSYPIVKDRLHITIGRTKIDKALDFEAKLLLLKQTEKNEMPVSVAFYHSTSLNTDAEPTTPDNAFFSDSTTTFENKFVHRLDYNTQIVIARKFGKKFAFKLSPTLIYQNLVEDGRENLTLVLSGGGKYSYKPNSAIFVEGAYIINNRTNETVNPLSIGIEFGTAGHVFQLLISSSSFIHEQNIYTKDNFDYTDGKFVLGFNIRRTWWF